MEICNNIIVCLYEYELKLYIKLRNFCVGVLNTNNFALKSPLPSGKYSI